MDGIDLKVKEFSLALNKYETQKKYFYIHLVCASLVVFLQALSFSLIFLDAKFSWLQLLISIPVAFILADFINGLIHMIMDNNTHYTSIVGPLIAVFHLHHAKLKYLPKPVPLIYFHESGFKIWLAVYLCILVFLQVFFNIAVMWLLIGAFFAVFSSMAEVSHYLCHNYNNQKGFIAWLQKNHILLNKSHHLPHHREDNIQYAFLNGLTDPVLNLIAASCCKGYKNHADFHVALYTRDLSKC